MNGKGGQAVVQIHPELPIVALLFKIAIAGGNDADVHLLGFGLANFQKFSIFEYPQQLGLQFQGHFPNLIQKKGAFMGFFQ